ncbi:MAG: molybdopterin-dependent oxidoreductase, partial [Myxococcales bacterium]|nr:molybdopterin-dependent oxidoreductase [Myxococcales bacterium]
VAASCRMCLVHIESGRQMAMPILRFDAGKKQYVPDTKPKLMPACQMEAAEGMLVSSKGEAAQSAQATVQELLLLNHPVDCPICDQAGECKLQDYWLEHGSSLKRKRTERVRKPKAQRFGPTIVYDAERCVLCTRCIRVCEELAGDPVLDLRERGNRNEVFVAPGRELDHEYTLMTEHVCPVGALTSRDFRFKARVWFLKSAPGICTGCATGCNTHLDYDPRDGRVVRLRPRDNMDVNRFWMCDDGMLSYRRVHEERILAGLLGRGEAREPISPNEAIEEAARRLAAVDAQRVAIVLSAAVSSEDNTALVRLGELLGTQRIYLAARADWQGDAILRHRDANPNRAGALRAAGGSIDEGIEDLVSDVMAGEVRAVIALGPDTIESADALAPLEELDAFISLSSNTGTLTEAASVVIPTSSWAEQSATYVNAKGMAQIASRAIPSPHGVEPAWRALVALGERLGLELGYASIAEIRAGMAQAAASAQSEAAAGGAAAEVNA